MADHNRLRQLDTILDKMFASESFRQRAKDSGLDVLRVAATLIEASPPQLPVITRHLIREQMLEVFDDVMAVSGTISGTTPSLPETARADILAKLMVMQPATSEPEPALSATARDRIFGKMLSAQQQLQLDALVESEEALAIARTSDDPVIQAAVKLYTTPPPQLSPVAKARIREQVLPAPPVTTRSKPIIAPEFAASLQRIAASIAIVLFIGIVAVPPASADSLPGELLYPVKRGLESFSLKFAGSDLQQAKIHINHAYERLDELSQVSKPTPLAYHLLDSALESAAYAHDLILDHPDAPLQNRLDGLTIVASQAIATSGLEDETLQALNARLDTLVVSIEPDDTSPPQNDSQGNAGESRQQAPSLNVPDEGSEPLDDSQEQVTVVVPETTSIATETITLYANAITFVRVRSAPSLASSIVTRIEPGDAVTQIATSDDLQWIQVLLDSGEQGWIASFLLVDYPVTPQPPAPALVEDPQNVPSVQANNAPSSASSGDAGGTRTDTDSVSSTSENQGNNGVRTNVNGTTNGNVNGNANGNGRPDDEDDDDDDDDED